MGQSAGCHEAELEEAATHCGLDHASQPQEVAAALRASWDAPLEAAVAQAPCHVPPAAAS